MVRSFFIFFLLALTPCLFGFEPISPCVEATLVDPVYRDGLLSTESGGIITGPNFYLQARKILYTKTKELHTVTAEGDLLVEYEGHYLKGDSLFYDFNHAIGSITCAKSALFPWTFGGNELTLCPNGDIVIAEGWLSPETAGQDLLLVARQIRLSPNHLLRAERVGLNVGKTTLFALPTFSCDLSYFEDIPFSLRYGWHGYRGSYLGLRYHFLTLGDFKGYARVDGYMGHGLGGGIETTYCPPTSRTQFMTRSYYAHDIAIDDPEKKDRYRFQGLYDDILFDGTTSFNVVYDKVSDAQMASDYLNDDFNLKTAERTQLLLHQTRSDYIANFFTLFKLNSFQTVNQELPTFELALRPKELFDSGILFENYLKASYLNYSFSDEIFPKDDFRSGRIEVRPHLSRPFDLGPLKMNPEATFIGIFYSQNALDESVGQALFDLGLEGELPFYRRYGCFKHVIEPYGAVHCLTTPRSPLRDHYLFTIDDAYDTLNILRFGTKHLFFNSTCTPPLSLDLFANYFFDTKTMESSIPKGYLLAELSPTPFLTLRSFAGWNFTENCLDFINARAEWTVSEDVAISTEYRQKSRFDWRKADFYNFLLENVRTTEELLHSALSDRNDLVLLCLFYRPSPDFSAKFELRNGWHRLHQPAFTEYQIETETPIFENFRLCFTYEKKESDNRFLFTLRMAPSPP